VQVVGRDTQTLGAQLRIQCAPVSEALLQPFRPPCF
jgi:hypothetical protein